LPAVWLPYGSTSIGIKVDEDLAWVFPEGLIRDYVALLPVLNDSLRSVLKDVSIILVDPTLPVRVKDFLKRNFSGNIKELPRFDTLKHGPDESMFFKSACLLSYPHLDQFMEFRGLGESLLPFHQTLWKEFRRELLEALKSNENVNIKSYLKALCNELNLKLIMLTPWAEGSRILSANSPVEAHEILSGFKKRFSPPNLSPRVEVLLVSAGGDPFDESLSRAMSIFPNCLRGCDFNRVVLVFEGSKGLGLDPELFLKSTGEFEIPLVSHYIELCKTLLKDKTVHVVSAIPESILKTIVECRAYDTLSDAYRASRLFLPKDSKTGVVTYASFAIL
jgi:hypothetical protein